MDIKNAVVLVTGANRGLGRALVEALKQAGAAKIYAAARNPAAIDQQGVTAIALDVTSPDSIAAAAKACPDVNVVINNAGIARGGVLLSDTGEQTAREEMDTNFWGPWRVTQAFAPTLARNGGGALVNVLSVLSWISLPGTATYCVSKAAAWSLTNGLRNELRGQGTQVVGVHLGLMDTDMTAGFDAPKIAPKDVAEQIVRALQDGSEEVLADDTSRQVKASLSSPQAAYLSAGSE
ncbi:SDR family oxidoreductase [Lysobacter arenosi]|jgi:NAD(P)-dependent dehydrogenase (short-subunit alcohol dehydrogenase family)|uniref:SDR family oxidoreductase n=1 Tax=Lysobacter arenosi TaxID=2795387 RepID=A0ABX7RB52_9GAMM|nr:SDR family oxidoreductase [Lysobacter arenosi]QSX74626.1 SDR family oxidoreductase [Lysobacter arenosi]